MTVDGHDGELYDVEETSTDTLLEIRAQTVVAVIEHEIPGRNYWQDQLDDIDHELLLRGIAQHPMNGAWHGLVGFLLDALKQERWDRVKAGTKVTDLPRWQGVPSAVSALTGYSKLSDGESSESCLNAGLVCSIQDDACTECGAQEFDHAESRYILERGSIYNPGWVVYEKIRDNYQVARATFDYTDKQDAEEFLAYLQAAEPATSDS